MKDKYRAFCEFFSPWFKCDCVVKVDKSPRVPFQGERTVPFQGESTVPFQGEPTVPFTGGLQAACTQQIQGTPFM